MELETLLHLPLDILAHETQEFLELPKHNLIFPFKDFVPFLNDMLVFFVYFFHVIENV